MDHDGDTPPAFWSQPHHHHHRRRRTSPIINPVVLLLAISIFLLLLLLYIVPPFVSHANQTLRSNSVKKSLDSFNVTLVLFAIICGVFSRKKDDTSSSSGDRNSDTFSNISSYVNGPRQHHQHTVWYESHDRKEYGFSGGGASAEEGAAARLKRNSGSYPDLRQESSWVSDRNRFYDDTDVGFYRTPPRENLRRRPRRRSTEAVKVDIENETVVKEIPVDKVEISSKSIPPPQSPPSPPPQSPPSPPHAQLPSVTNLKRRRASHSVPRKKEAEKQRSDAQFTREKEIDQKQSKVAELSENQPPAPTPPPPPPPPPPEPPAVEIQVQKLQRKTSGTKELASAIASLYKGQTKKRKKKVKTIYEKTEHNSFTPPPRATNPPPPPPPPPPSKMFKNLFRKGVKNTNKRIHSAPTTGPPLHQPYPPPPPPPPSSILNSIFKNGTKSRRHNNPAPAPPPPLQRREVRHGKPPKPPTRYNERVIIAPPSPLIPMPPPPPPFSSRGSSPELEDYDVVSVKSDGGDSIGTPTSCPSPDVNLKADSFIARLRDEWRLEKINSIKEKRNMTTRARGRPRKTWMEVIRNDMKLKDLSEDMLVNRNLWRQKIHVHDST